MNDQVIIGIATTVGVGIGLAINAARQKKKNAAIGGRITEVLRAVGEPRTLKEIAGALGMGGFYARGKVFMALTEMVNAKAVESIDAPAGTPQLKKVDFIRYRLIG